MLVMWTGFSRLPLAWVVPAAGRHHHCERMWPSSGPGGHPDSVWEGVWRWVVEATRGAFWMIQATIYSVLISGA